MSILCPSQQTSGLQRAAQILLRKQVPAAPEGESVVKVLSQVLFASQSSVKSGPQRASELRLQGISSKGKGGRVIGFSR